MWIPSKAGEALYNMDKVVNFYVVEGGRDSAVRARFSDGQKDLTIGNYNTCTEAKAAIKYVYDCIRQNYPAIQLPSEEKIEMLRRPSEMKDRSATMALRAGMPITLVSKLLGHESIATTQIYLDISDKELEQTHEKYVV